MTINQAFKLVFLMMDNLDLTRVHWLRMSKVENDWHVFAEVKSSGEKIQMRSISDYHDWVLDRHLKAQ